MPGCQADDKAWQHRHKVGKLYLKFSLENVMFYWKQSFFFFFLKGFYMSLYLKVFVESFLKP